MIGLYRYTLDSADATDLPRSTLGLWIHTSAILGSGTSGSDSFAAKIREGLTVKKSLTVAKQCIDYTVLHAQAPPRIPTHIPVI
ncbi:hypothetical protein E6O75_ATG04174 [Venturia nashicola]|uniref:Uncharacterized protein n=1 Tax=Venturia nashicola TaxID=86259 RepID=A0A4Z1PCF6_9PEZI|nr:hypothetical protein E6O75_ATG04174 [Venturia nashicola]